MNYIIVMLNLIQHLLRPRFRIKSGMTTMTTLTLLIALILAPTTHAAPISLGVNPPLIHIVSKVPASINESFQIKNNSDSPVELEISLKPFTANSENGFVAYTQDNPDFLQRIEIWDEQNAIKSITLSPYQEKKLQLKTEITQNDPASDYYFSVLFVSKDNKNPTDDFTGASRAALGIAINVLLQINPGDPKAQIEEFSTPFFVEKGPVPFTVRIRNTGTTAIAPTGTILITNMFGQTIGKVDLLPVNILTGTIRAIPDSASAESSKLTVQSSKLPQAYWHESFLLGPYTAKLTVNTSNKGPVYSQTIHFVSFPTVGFFGIVLTILAVLFIRKRVQRKLYS